jgi:ADP-heptose:LPS heptosyltransferase
VTDGLLWTAGPWRRIAILRPGRIGDYLCATPAIRAIRRAAPDAELHYIALPLVRDLVERNPSVDRFVAFPGFPYIAEQFFTPRRAVEWLAQMQDQRYDLVVQLYGSGVYANPVALLMGGRKCAGFVKAEDQAHQLDAAIALPQTGAEVDRVLALTGQLGAEPAGRAYDLRLSPADHAEAGRVLHGLPRPIVGLHCGARDADRRGDPALFAGAAAILQSAAGGSVVVLGGQDERSVTATLAARLADASVPCRDLTGALPLATTAAVIAGLDGLLTTDSGPAHLAYAVATPSVTVYVASDPRRWAPPVPGPHSVVDARGALPLSPRALAAALLIP